jgi:C1A family cysteine protease
MDETKLEERKFGWKPDLPDKRDFKYSYLVESIPTTRAVVTKVDLRPLMSPVRDQKDLGSCTSFAIGGAFEYLQLLALDGKYPPAESPEIFTPGKFEIPSCLYIYYNERVIEGTVNQDSGAMLRTGVKTLRASGVCRDVLWPYDTSRAFRKPNADAYTEGSLHKMVTAFRIESPDEMKTCLRNGFPFFYGMMLYSSFMSADVKRTGVVPMPNEYYERTIGGHAILAVGFDDEKQSYIVKNSWGTAWGDKGYFYMPYEYMHDSDLCADFWTLRRTAPVPVPPVPVPPVPAPVDLTAIVTDAMLAAVPGIVSKILKP